MKSKNKPVRFSFVPEKCTTCGGYNIRRVVLQYDDFNGLNIEEMKLCQDCNSIFNLDMNLEDVSYNDLPPRA